MRWTSLGLVMMALAPVLLGTACGQGNPLADARDGATPPPDGGPGLESDAYLEITCPEGSTPDALGRCAQWTHLTSAAPECFDVEMTELPHGDVLVLGNCHEPAAPTRLSSGFVFDPGTSTFRELADAPPPTVRRTMTRLSDGRVLIAGGVSDDAAGARTIGDAWLFDEASAGFTTTPPMTTPRWFHTATLLGDGRVLVAGGSTQLVIGAGSGDPTTGVEIYDPRTNTWQPAAPMRVARTMHTANVLDNGRVIALGGVDASGPSSAVEIYDPVRDAWHDGPSLETTPVSHTANVLSDGSLVVLAPRTAVRSFSAATGFLPIAPMLAPREGHIAIEISGSLLLVVGGVTSGGDELPTAELYDPVSGTWTRTHTPDARIWSTGPSNAALLPHGVLIHSDNVGFFVYTWPAPHF